MLAPLPRYRRPKMQYSPWSYAQREEYNGGDGDSDRGSGEVIRSHERLE